MSTLPKTIPNAWVSGLFEHMQSVYGNQKIAAMWGDVDKAHIMQTWATALAKYPPGAIAAAALELPERPLGWPPTLPEFVTMVRDAAEAGRNAAQPLALLGPGEVLADPESPKVIEARAELRRFINARKMPS